MGDDGTRPDSQALKYTAVVTLDLFGGVPVSDYAFAGVV